MEWSTHGISEAMQTVVKLAITQNSADASNSLLPSAASIVAVLVEPPLFDINYKQKIADVLLNEIGVRALVYLARSVCCTAACKAEGAIVRDEKFLVPVYDKRELSTQIRARGEFSDKELINQIKQASALDLRKCWDLVIDAEPDIVWEGAEILSRSNIGPVLARGGRERVWDALYDWN